MAKTRAVTMATTGGRGATAMVGKVGDRAEWGK